MQQASAVLGIDLADWTPGRPQEEGCSAACPAKLWHQLKPYQLPELLVPVGISLQVAEEIVAKGV